MSPSILLSRLTLITLTFYGFCATSPCLAANFEILDFGGRSHLIQGALQSKNGKHYALRLQGSEFIRYSLQDGAQVLPDGLIDSLNQVRAVTNNGKLLIESQCKLYSVGSNGRKRFITEMSSCKSNAAATMNVRGTVIFGNSEGGKYKIYSVRKGRQTLLESIALPTDNDIINLVVELNVSDNGKFLLQTRYFDYSKYRTIRKVFDLRRNTKQTLKFGRLNSYITMNSKGKVYGASGKQLFRWKKGRRLRPTARLHFDTAIIESAYLNVNGLTALGTLQGNFTQTQIKDFSTYEDSHYEAPFITNKKGKVEMLSCLIPNNQRLEKTKALSQGENKLILTSAKHKDDEGNPTRFFLLRPLQQSNYINYCARFENVSVDLEGQTLPYQEALNLVWEEDERMTTKACTRMIRVTDIHGNPLSGRTVQLSRSTDLIFTDENGIAVFSRGNCEQTIHTYVLAPFADSIYQPLQNYFYTRIV